MGTLSVPFCQIIDNFFCSYLSLFDSLEQIYYNDVLFVFGSYLLTYFTLGREKLFEVQFPSIIIYTTE